MEVEFIEKVKCKTHGICELPPDRLKGYHCNVFCKPKPVLVCSLCQEVFKRQSRADDHEEEHFQEEYIRRLREGNPPIGEWAMRYVQ